MKFEYIELFVRVAAHGNISQAGREFGLSPAVSSAHIHRLEEDLGVRLLHRTTRRVTLTSEGEVFLAHAIGILDDVEVARSAVGSGDIAPKGKLRITASASFGRMHLVPALGGFLKQYPDIEIDMNLSDTIVDLVQGGFDVAIRNAAVQDSTLIARKLTVDNRVLCAAPEYVMTHGKPQNPAELAHHRCVTLPGLDTWVFKATKGNTSVKIGSWFRADNGEAVRDAAVNGLGITLSSTWCAYEHLKSGQLVQVLKDYPVESNTAIWAIYPSARLLAPKVRVFIDYLIQRFEGMPYWDKDLNI